MSDKKLEEFMEEYASSNPENIMDPTPSRIAKLEAEKERDELSTKLNVAEKALEFIRSKTLTDPAHEVELRARASVVFTEACEALAKIGRASGA